MFRQANSQNDEITGRQQIVWCANSGGIADKFCNYVANSLGGSPAIKGVML